MLFSFFVFFFCLFLVLFYNVHYIFLLLLLEALLLVVFVYMGWFYLAKVGLAGLFFFLLVIVCLGGFSISLLVSIARGAGRDFWFFTFIF